MNRLRRHHRPLRRMAALLGAGIGLALAWAATASAAPATPPAAEPGLLCRRAIRQAEAGSPLPPHMLGGIARVESGRRDPATGRFHPWPWTINAEGRGYFFDSKAEAIAFARQLQGRGVRSFDVGCLQVNLAYHPDAFASLEDAFDPVANARYAVKFLTELRDRAGSWETASAWYHSANPEQGTPYRGMVVNAMAEEAKGAPAYASLPDLAAGGAATAGMPGLPVPSMPAGPGRVMMLAGPSSGAILARSYASMSSPAGGGAPAGGGLGGIAGGVGRGLDAYRMQPVAILGPRLIASR